MDENSSPKFVLNKNEVERKYTRGSGNGGQNRNKVVKSTEHGEKMKKLLGKDLKKDSSQFKKKILL